MTTIILAIKHGAWVATWIGPGAREVYRTLGTTQVETPYLASADPSVVYDDIAAHNPDCDVWVAI